MSPPIFVSWDKYSSLFWALQRKSRILFLVLFIWATFLSTFLHYFICVYFMSTFLSTFLSAVIFVEFFLEYFFPLSGHCNLYDLSWFAKSDTMMVWHVKGSVPNQMQHYTELKSTQNQNMFWHTRSVWFESVEPLPKIPDIQANPRITPRHPRSSIPGQAHPSGIIASAHTSTVSGGFKLPWHSMWCKPIL